MIYKVIPQNEGKLQIHHQNLVHLLEITQFDYFLWFNYNIELTQSQQNITILFIKKLLYFTEIIYKWFLLLLQNDVLFLSLKNCCMSLTIYKSNDSLKLKNRFGISVSVLNKVCCMSLCKSYKLGTSSFSVSLNRIDFRLLFVPKVT